MGDRIQVPLELDDFDVVGSQLVEGVLEVRVASTFPRACFHCGSVDVVGHGRCSRRLRDRSCGFPTVLVWEQRRFWCRDCGRTSRERHPETLGAKRLTARFRTLLASSACAEPWSDIASRERVSWWRVADAFDDHADRAAPFSGEPPRVISIDEAAFKKRFKYHTVLSAPEQKRIVELVEGRNRASATAILHSLPEQWKQEVETVVIDMFWPFRQAVESVLPDARIVADRFHVVRAVDAAANKVRVRHGRRRTVIGRDGGISRQHNPRFDPNVWQSRWLFMKRRTKLSAEEQDRLDSLFELHPEVALAWWLKEEFAYLYEASDRAEAETRLDLWAHHITESAIPELVNMWRTLSHWRDLILNYHEDPQTNGYAEGITNKIKVLKRRGYGHRHPDRYRAKVISLTSTKRINPPPIA